MTLDDLVVPATAASAAALEVASAYQLPALLNHSLRAYVWAAAHGMTRGIGLVFVEHFEAGAAHGIS